ncbi:MAG: phosphate ABC transporter permease PstA, partial [Stenotrophobium sp.]
MAAQQSRLYTRRRIQHLLAMSLACIATTMGLLALVWILGTLVWKGFDGLSLAVFTQMTPPPGSAGGLLNAIYGSFIQTLVATLIGTPIGILAGT